MVTHFVFLVMRTCVIADCVEINFELLHWFRFVKNRENAKNALISRVSIVK